MSVFRRRKWYGPTLQEDIEELTKVIQHHYSDHITEGSAPKVARRILENEPAELLRYRAAINDALHELGVPSPEYPAPVANAHAILTASLTSNSQ